MKRRLPVIDPSVSRRAVLQLGVSASVAACGARANFGYTRDPFGNPIPVDDAGDPVDETDMQPDTDAGSPVVDAGSPPTDVGFRDSGVRDTGVRDTGVVDTGPVDTGPVDTGPVDTGPSCTPDPTSLGPVSNFAPGTWTLMRTQRVIVAHDAGGLFAYSAVCTHSGCVVDPPAADGSCVCRCHNSYFDNAGNVTGGPARRALAHYDVVVCNGNVTMNSSRSVAASTRTPAA